MNWSLSGQFHPTANTQSPKHKQIIYKIISVKEMLKNKASMIVCTYFEEDKFFVLVEVQGWIDISRDVGQAFGEAGVKFEARVSPYFVFCYRIKGFFLC